MTAYIVDTETTGQPAPDLEVIELSYMVWGNPNSALGYRFKPKRGSTCGALSAHHILNEELEGCAPSTDAKLPADCSYMIGHNVDYDWEALGKPNVKRICTLAMSRWHYTDTDKHTLGAMAYRLLPPREARELLKEAHSAVGDVILCTRIWEVMLKEQGLSEMPIDALWLHSEKCRVPRVMPFGKYWNQPINTLPHEYKMWCLRQKDMDAYVLRAIRESL